MTVVWIALPAVVLLGSAVIGWAACRMGGIADREAERVRARQADVDRRWQENLDQWLEDRRTDRWQR